MKEKRVKNRFYNDTEFLNSPDARSIRILAEYLGPKNNFNLKHIEDTIVFFGSARIKSKEEAQAALNEAPTNLSGRKRRKLKHDLELSAYYEDASELAKRLTIWSKKLKNQKHRYIITSGGGPGIMEAANRGASEAKGLAVGLNITLPFEQSGNRWTTPDLNMQFHYFFMRKYWMAYLAKALVVFPGGFGTLDELMELLTLMQTKKIKKRIPVVLYGEEFWSKVVNWEYLVSIGTIEKRDLNLFRIINSVNDAFHYITEEIAKADFKGPNF
jgi:uncharacterized protein (TIGR00730 family)